jgi:predicted aconitase
MKPAMRGNFVVCDMVSLRAALGFCRLPQPRPADYAWKSPLSSTLMELTEQERAIAAGDLGGGPAMALRIVADTGRLLGADRLIPVESAHIDGCLYHGDSGVLFAERLVELGARVAVPTTLNVGALDLMHPDRSRLSGERRAMALRLVRAYEAMGCQPTWTCSPYQAGHRPPTGADVAWGESNAVAFCNSVLGARTNRYGDFLDIACAIVGRAPRYGLHLEENRRATLLVDASGLSPELRRLDTFFPVLGAWLGRNAGRDIAAIDGLEGYADEDRLKALGAAAASFGAVGLFHVIGVTPEAPNRVQVFGNAAPARTVTLTPGMMRAARDWLSTASGGEDVRAVAVGSPHLSQAEVDRVAGLLGGRKVHLPFFVHTGRHVLRRLAAEGRLADLEATGVSLVADTCIVVTPILPDGTGVLLTNSGKFANYAPGLTGWSVVYGSLEECVQTALSGRLVRDERPWS